MRKKSYLVLRSVNPLYKKVGLLFALLPCALFTFIFVSTLVITILDPSGLYSSADSAANISAQWPPYIGGIAISAIFFPVVAYFMCGGYLAYRFMQAQFSGMAKHNSTSYKALAKGWLEALTRSHIVAFLVSLLSFLVLLGCAYFMGGEDSGTSSEMPVGITIAISIIVIPVYLILWAFFNVFVWVIITVPLAVISSLILRAVSFKRVRC